MGSVDFVVPEFIELMREIGQYGFEKHGEKSFQTRILNGDRSRWERIESPEIQKHITEHGEMYLRGELHDHFGTLKHQLAAQAYNAMMEFHLANLSEKEKENVRS